MARKSDDYYRGEIRQGRKLMYQGSQEMRRRNRLRVKMAVAKLIERRDRAKETPDGR